MRNVDADTDFLHGVPRPERGQQFRLVRLFMLISLVVIGLISVISASSLANYLTRQILDRDFAVSSEFVNSIVRVRDATSYFYGANFSADAPEMEAFFRHVADLPDVIRANVYGFDRTVLWSSDPALIGQNFDDNDELESAFRNDVHAEIEFVEQEEKGEHINFPLGVDKYIESYLPIWSEDNSRVVGAVEVYKSPIDLLASIQRGRILIWFGAGAAGFALFVGLSLVVRYAGRILQEQEVRLVESERLAVVGEMTSAVAHGLRNPLAAIRSCAELALEDELPADAKQSIGDIVSQADRLEGWIRTFLISARENPANPHLCRLDDVIRDCLQGFAPQMSARNIAFNFEDIGESPFVATAPAELGQVLNTLLSNSIEAMDCDGEIHIKRAMEPHNIVRVTVADTGPGLSDEVTDRLFQAFSTGKPSGLGVGLALARRTVVRFGGRLIIENGEPRGACATLHLPAFGG